MLAKSSQRKLLGGFLLASASLLATAAMAWAAAPEKGKHYSGQVTTDSFDTVSFNVSSNGKEVVKLKLVVPSKCETGAFKPPPAHSAKITSKGTFKTTFALTSGAPSGGKAGTETVTGVFLAGGKEKGKITTHASGSLSACSTTVSYTTKAS